MGDIKITGIDHFMLSVADQEASLAFYVDGLGLQADRVDEWHRGEARFPSVRLSDRTIIDLASAGAQGGSSTTPGFERINHFCFLVEPMDFSALQHSGRFNVEGDASVRYGAQGFGTSLFLFDPDNNRVELRHYEK
jgi:catechol 2,3-dioxygenase-like lactoylglutathione lyase family enzyme